MNDLHPLLLNFRSAQLERRYRQYIGPRVRLQGRLAILVGIGVYLQMGLLDFWFVPRHLWADTWQARITALGVPVVVALFSLTRAFMAHIQLWLSLVAVAAGVGLIVVQGYLPLSSVEFFSPGIILLIFYSYNFIGIRFIHGLLINVATLLAYNLVFGIGQDYPLDLLIGQDIFLVSASLIGGSAGYLAERQRRMLFLRESELDRQRHFHFQRSLHDSLTGLPNRELLADRIRQAIALSRREGGNHCGLFLDMDGFKAINDRFGHPVGDSVLVRVADRLRRNVRETDTVARLGGDEFFVLLVNVEDSDEMGRCAEKLLTCLEEPFAVEGESISLGASIGICRFPYEGMSVDDIILRADQAMYDVKQDSKGTFAYS